MKNLILPFFVFLFNTVTAQNVVLDSSFAEEGKFQYAEPGNKLTFLNEIKILPNGKLRCFLFDVKSLYFTQHNENGLVDSTFGVDGIVRITPNNLYTNTNVNFYDDGAALIGASWNTTDSLHSCVLKFNNKGELDKTFAQNAVARVKVSEEITKIETLSRQNDGKIVIVGSYSDSAGVAQPYIGRLDKNGKFDPTFNSKGFYRFEKDTLPDFKNNSMSFQFTKDNKILFDYSFTNDKKEIVKRIYRFLQNGTIDKTFNKNTGIIEKKVKGMAYYDTGYIFDAYGNTYITEASTIDFSKPIIKTITKLNADESINKSFGTAGVFTIPAQSSFPYFLGDGSFLYTTNVKIGTTKNYKCELRRAKVNGQLDTNFGNKGIVSTDIGTYNVYSYVHSIDKQGRILVAGSLDYLSQYGYFIIRYLSEKNLDNKDIAANKIDVNIFPNPAKGNINVEYLTDNERDTQIEIYNITGDLIYKQKEIGANGKYLLNINIAEKLATGNYVLKITSNGNILAVKKFSKID